MDALDLQAQVHAPSCLTRAKRAGEDGIDIGTTDAEWCTCGLAQDLAKRDGPSVRPNWRKGKR